MGGAGGEGFGREGEDLLGEFGGGGVGEELGEGASLEMIEGSAEDGGTGVVCAQDEEVGIDEHDADGGVLEADTGLFCAEAAAFGGAVSVGEVGEGYGEEGWGAVGFAEDFTIDTGEPAEARVVEPRAEREGGGGLEGGVEVGADLGAGFGCDEGLPGMVYDIVDIESDEAKQCGVREEAGAVWFTDPDGGREKFESFEVGCAHGQSREWSPVGTHRCCSSGGRKGRNRFLSMAFM